MMPASSASPLSRTSSGSSGGKTDNKKPKRPLSGYNLFYRYKRNKVLEATVRAASNNSNSCSESSDDNARIRAIITSLAGLENVLPSDPLWSLPPQAINEIRGTTIRREMEGKLFPNENARNRLHRKVHGMGFVEMGSLMREMWARVDDYTKKVFGELADVGRVRYRRLLAEYKVKENGSLKTTSSERSGSVGAVAAAAVAVAASQPQDKKINNKRTSFSLPNDAMIAAAESFAPSSIAMCAEVTPKPAKKANVHMSPAIRQVNMPFAQMPVAPVVSSSNIMTCSSAVLSSQMSALSSNNSYLASLGTSSFEPLSVSTNFGGPPKKVPQYERRVSNDSLCESILSTASTPTFCREMATTPNSQLSALYQAHSQVASEYQALLLKNSLPPPPLFSSDAESITMNDTIVSSGSSIRCCDTVSADQPEQASAEDFMELLGTLSDDKAAMDNTKNDHDSSLANIVEKKATRRPSVFFGKPMHDVVQQQMMVMNPISIPFEFELNNSRARMA